MTTVAPVPRSHDTGAKQSHDGAMRGHHSAKVSWHRCHDNPYYRRPNTNRICGAVYEEAYVLRYAVPSEPLSDHNGPLVNASGPLFYRKFSQRVGRFR